MNHPVIAIGLDSADPALLEHWMSQGYLKNLSRLRQQGTYAGLTSPRSYLAEALWTTVWTGCSAQTTGHWTPLKYEQDTYDIDIIGAYDFAEYPPFYALGDDYRVAIFDLSQVTLSEQTNGVQVLAWGASAAQTLSCSKPASLLQELIDRHGANPALTESWAELRDIAALENMQRALKTGIARRAAISRDILQREDWDLFVTVFDETHTAGHFFWHLSQPDHPLHTALASKASGDLLLENFIATDQAIGNILESAPDDAYIIVFAAHGMGAGVHDLPSMVFLPELLYRFNFPGKFGIAPGKLETAPGQPFKFYKRDWLREVWSYQYDPNPMRGFLRRELPTRLFNPLEKLFGRPQSLDLTSPDEIQDLLGILSTQPGYWYRQLWSQMRAFALPSYSEGYIRINLQGRDAAGIVVLSEYDALCDELSQLLYRLKDGRTGKPMVEQVIRTRLSPADSDPKLPDADLIVIWQEDYATDAVESPDLGLIGPIPYFWSGDHRPDGFFMAKGPGIVPGSTLPTGKALDLAPTILNLMGAPIPSYFEGRSLLETTALVHPRKC